MLGIKHIKFDSTSHVIHYKKGKIKAEGKGLSFFYFAPSSSIVAIPLGSNNLPFIFNETTQDYQTVTIQGQITYKVTQPKVLAEVLDFTVNDDGTYKKNDIEKLNQRIINTAQTSLVHLVHDIDLKGALRSAKDIEDSVVSGFSSSSVVEMMGIEILGVNILAVTATPEMMRALETETREKLQQNADQAIYERRNFAVEQERIIKESELNTEIAVEEKQKQITEKKMQTRLLEAENERTLRDMNLETDIAIETKREKLIEQKSKNERQQADAKGYVIEATIKPYKNLDWKVLTALGNSSDPKMNLSLAFREMAEKADKIGNLNLTPDLLQTLMENNNNQ